MSEVGKVQYGVKIEADESGLSQAIHKATKAIESFEKTFQGSVGKLEKAFSGMEKAMSSVGKVIDSSVDSSKRASKANDELGTSTKTMANAAEIAAKAKTEEAKATQLAEAASRRSVAVQLDVEKRSGAAARQVEKLATSYSNLGIDAEKFIRPLTRALSDYTSQVDKAAGDSTVLTLAQEDFKNALHSVQVEMMRHKAEQQNLNNIKKEYVKDSKEAEKATLEMVRAEEEAYKIVTAMEKALGAAGREVQTLTSKLQQMKDGEAEIVRLNEALKDYQVAMREAGGDTLAITRAQETYKNSVNSVRNEMTRAGGGVNSLRQGMQSLELQLQNTSKAVQLALGPLSGIAARITAFTTLIKSNTVAVASFVATIVGLALATQQTIGAGIEFERQMLGMEAVLQSTGRNAEITTSQLNALAESIAEATLSGTAKTRQAATLLTTYSNIAVESFEAVLVSAQGLASLFGTDLVGATRQVARALEDPKANLDALRRVGIQFNDVEKQKIRSLQSFGRIAEAQAIVMTKFAAAQDLARKEAQGLAGQLDTMRERLFRLREQAALYADSNGKLGSSIGKLNEVLLRFMSDTSNFEIVLQAISAIISVMAVALQFLADKMEVVIALVAAAFVTGLIKGTMALVAMAHRTYIAGSALDFYAGKAIVAAKTNLALATSAATVTRATAAFSMALRTIPLVAAGAALLYFYNRLKSASDETKTLEFAVKELSSETDRAKRINDLYTQSLTASAAQAKALRDEQAELAKQGFSLSLSNSLPLLQERLRLVQAEMANLRSSISVIGGSANTFQIPLAEQEGKVKKLAEALEVLNEAIASSETVTLSMIDGVISAFDEIGQSDSVIAALSDEFKEYMATTGRAIREQAAYAEAHKEFIETFKVDPTMFFQGIKDNGLDELAGDMKHAAEMANVFGSAISSNVVAAEGIASVISTEYSSAIESLNQAFERGIISQEDFIRMSASLANEQDQIVQDLMNIPALYEKAARASIDDFLRPYNEHMQIAKARTEGGKSAVEELMKEFEKNKAIDDSINSLLQFNRSGSEMDATAHRLRKTLEDQGIAVDHLSKFFDENTGTLHNNADGIESTEDAFRQFIRAVYESLGLFDIANSKSKDFSETVRELTNTFMQAEVAAKGGLEALTNLVQLQDQESAVISLTATIKELSDDALMELASAFNITGLQGEALRKRVTELSIANMLAAREANAQVSAYEAVNSQMKDLMASYDDAQSAARALATGGLAALNKEMRNQEARKAIDGIRESWSKLTNSIDRDKAIRELQKRVTGVVVTSENYLEVLEELYRTQLQVSGSTDEMKSSFEALNNALETSIDKQTELMHQYRFMSQGLGSAEASALAQAAMEASKLAAEFKVIGEDSEAVQEHLAQWNKAFPDLFKNIEDFEKDYVEMMRRGHMQEVHLAKWAEAMDELEGMFADTWDNIFSHGEKGFKRSIQNMKKQFSGMLRDMLYEATVKPIMVQLSGTITGMMTGANAGLSGSGQVGLSEVFSAANLAGTLAKLGDTVNNAGNLIYSGMSNFGASAGAEAMGHFGSNFGALLGKELTVGQSVAIGAVASAVAGMAGKWVGTNVGEALFGKKANSSWGAAIGGVAGTAMGGPLGAFIGSTIGGMIDAMTGGDGKKRAFLGVDTNAGFTELQRGGTGYQRIAESGLKLTAMVNRAGEGAEEVANALVDAFAATDSALLGMYKSLTGFTADLAGVDLIGQMLQAGTPDAGAVPSFFGSAAFNELSTKDLEGAADNFVRAWVKKVNEISGNALDFEPLFALAQEGELLADSLIRLTNQFEGVNTWMGRLGQTLHGMSIETVVAADALVAVMGGLDNFAKTTEFYFNRFFSEAEKIEQITKEVTSAFNSLGQEVPKTRMEFREMINALDLTTESGRGMFAAFMALAPSLDMIVPAFDDIENAIEGLLDKSEELSLRLLQLTDSAAHLAAVRSKELKQLDDYSRALQIHIWMLEDLKAAHEEAIKTTDKAIEMVRRIAEEQIRALRETFSATDSMMSLVERSIGAAISNIEDNIKSLEGTFSETDRAFSSLERAVKAQQDSLKDQVDAAKEVENSIVSLFATIDRSVNSLRNSVVQTSRMAFEQARALLSSAASGGVVDRASISDAIAVAQSGVSSQRFSSRFERDVAMLSLAKTLEDIKNSSEPQLTEAQQQVALAEQQIELLNDQLDSARNQINTLRGIEYGIVSVEQATNRLQTAVAAEEQARIQITNLRTQVDVLNGQLEQAKAMVSALRGIDERILSVDEAIGLLQKAVDAEENARQQIEVIQDQLAMAEAQYEELRGINTGVKSVEQAISALAAAMRSERNVGQAPQFNYNPAYSSEDIRGFIDEVNRTSSSEAEAIARIYDAAIGAGVGSAQIAAATGFSQQQVIDFANSIGMPAFARGGKHSGGFRLVGENGPEIEATGPSRIFSARQASSAMFDTSDIVEAIMELKEELEHIQAGNVQIVKNTKGTYDIERRWEAIGLPKERDSV